MKERRYIFLVPIVVIAHSILGLGLNIARRIVLEKELLGGWKWNWNLKYLTVLSFITLVVLGLNIKFYWNLYKKQDTELLKDLKRFKIINWIGVSIPLLLQIIFIVKGFHYYRLKVSFFHNIIPLSSFNDVIGYWGTFCFVFFGLAASLLYLMLPIYILLQKDISAYVKKTTILFMTLIIVCILFFPYCCITFILLLYLNLIIDKINLK